VPVDWGQQFEKEVQDADVRRQALQNQYRQNRIQQYGQLGTEIQAVLSAGQVTDKATGQMRPLTPEEKAQLTNTAEHVDAYIQRLHDPKLDPLSGQLSEDPLHKLTDKLRLTKAPKQPAEGTPEMEKTRREFETQFGPTPAAEGAQARQDMQRNIEYATGILKKAGASDQVIQDVIAGMMGAKSAIQRAKFRPIRGKIDGEDTELMYNEATGEFTDLNGDPIPPASLARFVASPSGNPPKPRHAWSKTADGKTFSVSLDPYTNQEIPGTRNFTETPPASVVGRITTGFYHYVDQLTGAIHQIGETRTTAPAAGGTPAGPEPTAPGAPPPPPPAAGKATAAAKTTAKHGVVATQQGDINRAVKQARDVVLGNKGTKEEVQLAGDLRGAIIRQQTMHANIEDVRRALKEGRTDQQAMLSLLFNHIGMTSGAQRGTRITQTMINEAEQSVGAIAGLEARVGQNLEEVILRGIVLTPQQMESMVNLADEKVKILNGQMQDVMRNRGGAPGGVTGTDEIQQIIDALKKAK